MTKTTEDHAKALADIRATLAGFHGGDTIYRHPLFRRFLYTEGAQYVAEACGAYWLLDSIFAKQGLPAVAREEFQVWKLTTNNDRGLLTCEDGNDREVLREDIQFTDFPLPELTLWLENYTLMLPGER